MITSFEVGAVFKVINEASPALRQILKQVRDLNVAIEKARTNLALVGKMPALAGAAAETEALAAAWGNVAKNAALAQRALGGAATAAGRAGGAGGSGAAGAAAGGGRRRLGGWLGGGGGGGGGVHVQGPRMGIPGGSHVRLGGAGMAAAGLVGYGVYEAAQMEDAVWQLIYHSGQEHNDTNRAKFRKILQNSMSESGYGLHEISESAKQEIRMFQGTKGGGIDVLPEMLRAATIEARMKGESPEEAMKALIGLAHMTKEYSPEAIKKLAPAFAFLSTANPAKLGSIERAAGYAVPLLQSGLEIDPIQTLLMGTALTRAGAVNTRSGTWLREMAVRSMPGTSLMSKLAFKKHEQALKELGLSKNGKPTWFTDGKPDLFKMMEIAGENAAKIPVTRRAALERSLFGAQGSGAFALLADPAVKEQVQALRKEMDSPEFKNRYATFTESYKEGSTVQNARTAMADFNITLMELAKTTLPSVNEALRGLKGILEGIRDVLPSGNGVNGAKVGGAAALGGLGGAGAGALIGAFGGPVGALGGAVIGAAGGGAYSVAEQYMANRKEATVMEKLIAIEHEAKAAARMRRDQRSDAKTVIPHITIQLDGKTLADVVGQNIGETHPTQAPSYDPMGAYTGGDSQ
jgi:hypothetical protein